MVGFWKVIEQKEDKGGMGKGDKDTSILLKLKYTLRLFGKIDSR